MSDIAAVRPDPENVARAFLTPRPPTQRLLLALDGGETMRITTPSSPTRRSSPPSWRSSPDRAERRHPRLKASPMKAQACVALVTGAMFGLGRATAHRLAQASFGIAFDKQPIRRAP